MHAYEKRNAYDKHSKHARTDCQSLIEVDMLMEMRKAQTIHEDLGTFALAASTDSLF